MAIEKITLPGLPGLKAELILHSLLTPEDIMRYVRLQEPKWEASLTVDRYLNPGQELEESFPVIQGRVRIPIMDADRPYQEWGSPSIEAKLYVDTKDDDYIMLGAHRISEKPMVPPLKFFIKRSKTILVLANRDTHNPAHYHLVGLIYDIRRDDWEYYMKIMKANQERIGIKAVA